MVAAGCGCLQHAQLQCTLILSLALDLQLTLRFPLHLGLQLLAAH